MIYRAVKRSTSGWEVIDCASAEELCAKLGTSMGERVFKKHLRAELQNEPQIKGLLGPMWGGTEGDEVVIRYENQEACDRLSA